MDPSQLQPGHRLDRYELLCPLAYGGMASVWLARFGGRKGFERLVVVKMILPQYSQDPRFQEMFVDEARIASRIEHGNVARILDVGEHDESTFIVMEWVDGDSLSKIMRAAEAKEQRVPAGIALRVCADAAAGLHAAHILEERDGTHLGVVHRDVSPQNILVSNTGATVIIDFGVAKARDRVSQDTSAGQLKGKIRYMAPEQALGRTIDHRADVWALGAILYELFAGVAPYDGPNEVATLHKLTSGRGHAPLPPSVPRAVRAVVERALSYDPVGRFETALDLNVALEACMIEVREPTTPTVVAQYTGVLLADRKAARKRAVDAALASARMRDTGASLPIALATPGMPLIPRPPQSGATQLTPPLVMTGPPPMDRVERTSQPSGPHGVSGLAETPSAASSATLGSASMEYLPELHDDPARQKRFILAAAIGVSIAAGLVGAVLLVNAAVTKPKAAPSAFTAGSTPIAAPAAPAEAVDPTTLGSTPATAASNDSPAAASASESASARAAPITAPALAAPAAPTHAPRPLAPAVKPSTKPVAPSSTTKAPPDRGF